MSLVQSRTAANPQGTANIQDDYSDVGAQMLLNGFTQNFTPGNLIVFVTIHSSNGRVISTLTGGVAGGWNVAGSQLHLYVGGYAIHVHAAICDQADSSLTCVLNGSTVGTDYAAMLEFDHAQATVAESGTSTEASAAATTTHNCAAVTPSTTETVFIGAIGLDNTGNSLHPDADFTSPSNLNTDLFAVGYLIQSGSAAAQNWNNTTDVARTSDMVLVGIQMAAAGGPQVVLANANQLLRPFNMAAGRR